MLIILFRVDSDYSCSFKTSSIRAELGSIRVHQRDPCATYSSNRAHRIIRVLPLSAFKSNHSPLFCRRAGGEAFSSF